MTARVPEPSPSQQVTLLVADEAKVIRRTLRNFLKETRLLAENFGAVRMLDKTKLCDELIPAILQMEN